MQQSSPSTDRPRRWFTLWRLFDLLAIAVLAFVLWKIFVAPRSLRQADAFPAPWVSYQTLLGPPFVLHAQRGHVVFLDFYATWCEPCRLSLPLVESFARTHPEVEVVPIDVGEPRTVASAFARAHHLTHVAVDPQALSSGFFGLQGFPTMVVIDPRGRIRAKWEGFNPAIALNMAHAEKALSS